MDNEQLIFKYFPECTDEQKNQFKKLGSLYAEWNAKINVISRKDIDQLYLRHCLHALGIAKFYPFLPGQKVLDVGTGGGFPGIPLAILFPKTNFLLVDNIQKKIKVVDAVVQSLDLKNVETLHQRAEKVKGSFDFVVSRAVTRMKPFYQWVYKKIKVGKDKNGFSNGIIYLKGGDLDDEMKELGKTYMSIDLNDFFEEEFFETKKVIYLPLGRK